MTKMKVLGAAEVEALLNQLPARLARNVVGQSLGAGARVIVKAAKAQLRANPSIDSGLTERKVASRVSKGKAQVGIARGAMMVQRKGRTKKVKAEPSKTAHMLEYGTQKMKAEPFLRPALDEAGSEAIVKIGERMGQGVEREARALASGRKSFATGQKI